MPAAQPYTSCCPAPLVFAESRWADDVCKNKVAFMLRPQVILFGSVTNDVIHAIVAHLPLPRCIICHTFNGVIHPSLTRFFIFC